MKELNDNATSGSKKNPFREKFGAVAHWPVSHRGVLEEFRRILLTLDRKILQLQDLDVKIQLLVPHLFILLNQSLRKRLGPS